MYKITIYWVENPNLSIVPYHISTTLSSKREIEDLREKLKPITTSKIFILKLNRNEEKSVFK